MPRSNRRNREEHEPLDPAKMLAGWRRVVAKRDGEWHVQPMSGEQATKSYRCPGCHRDVVPGTAHLVTWRADGILSPADDLAGRRHWHRRCWELRA